MPNLTKEHFDEQLKKLATKKDLEPITETLKRTTALLSNVAEDVHDLKTDMITVKDSLDTHRTILDLIVKNTTDWKTEMASMNSAINRHEKWFTQLAEKVGIKLES